MIGTMRKHSTVVWSIVIVVVIIAFVFWGASPGNQGEGPAGIYGRINGQPVTEEDVISARNEVKLGYFFRFGDWPGPEAESMGFNMEREIFYLLLQVQKLEERKMYAGVEAKATVAANILNGLKSQGINTLADFEKALLERVGMNLRDLDRFIGHQIAMEQLRAVEGLAGRLVTPQQIESLWRRENHEISAQAVFFSTSDYLSQVKVTPDALGAFFTNQIARYRIPDRLQVSYVAFPISNYFAKADEQLAAITNLTELLDAEYLKRGTNAYPDISAEEAKEQLRDEERRRRAAFAARQAAATFADELWQQNPMKPSDLETLGTKQGLTVNVSEPFDRTGAPAGLGVSPAFAQAAFQLREDEPHAGPLEGDDDFYVITMNLRIPSVNADFADVKDEVTEDYRLQQATLKAREAGQAFVGIATNTLAKAEPFTAACSQADVTPQMLPAFSPSTRSLPEVEEYTSLGQFKQVAFATPVGEASRFNFTRDGGYVVYVGSQLPVDEVRMKEELPRYTEVVRQTLANEAFGVWFSREAQVGLQDTPLNQRPPAELASPGS